MRARRRATALRQPPPARVRTLLTRRLPGSRQRPPRSSHDRQGPHQDRRRRDRAVPRRRLPGRHRHPNRCAEGSLGRTRRCGSAAAHGRPCVAGR
jgi:hypothetical protein